MFEHTAIVVKLFPLLLPIWQQRPFTDTDLYPGPAPLDVAAEEVHLLRQGFTLSDRPLRCRIVAQLRETDTRLSYELLVAELRQQPDAKVTATILQQLTMMSHIDQDLGPIVQPLLQHPSQPVRYWSVRLGALLPEPPLVQLGRMALEAPDASVREAASAVLREHATDVDLGDFRTLTQATNERVRADAVAALCAKPGHGTCRELLLEACRDESVVVRSTLAGSLDRVGPELRQALGAALRQDKHPTVRSALAESLGRSRDSELFDVLAGFVTDRDAEVRRLAAQSLSAFPGGDALDALVAMLDDRGNLVRCAAQQSLVSIHDTFPVDQAVAKRVVDANRYVRYHVFRVLGRIDARQHARGVAQQLRRETEPENVAAAVFALGCFEARFVAAAVAKYGTHKQAEVRKETAFALGQFAEPTTFPLLKELAFDADGAVRQAALEAMGRIGDGEAFSSTLLRMLKTVTGAISGSDRATACWSAGQLRPISREVAERMVTQATQPVVPMMGMMEYEEEAVLVSAAFALAQCGREDDSSRKLAEFVHTTHLREYDATQLTNLPANTYVATPEVREYARQAQAYMNGEPVQQRPRPLRRLSYLYGRCVPDPTPEDTP